MAAADSGKPKGGGMMAALAVALVLAVLGGGGGYALGLHAVEVIRADATKTAEAAVPDLSETLSGSRKLVRLEPVIMKLDRPLGTWIRIEASLIHDAAEGPLDEVLTTEIRGDMAAFLGTLSVAHVEGASGLLHLREDLSERARMRSPRILDVVVTSLVIE